MSQLKFVLLFCCWVGWISVFAQKDYTVSPIIPDFTDLNASCVVATSGLTGNPFEKKGIVPERHMVITAQGTDHFTGDTLQYLPGGESKVVRLGNSRTGNQAESITYHFIVDPEKAVLFLKFAVVFEDPSHPYEAQPRFVVRIMNADNELIEPCAEYDVSARAEIEGFRTYGQAVAPVRWRDWTNVGLDMSRYAGQEVQVQFVTYDCEYSGHFGYAYFTASCISNKLLLKGCEGDRITVAAPAGFESYLWHTGESAPETQWTVGDEDFNLSCEVTSVAGCRFTLGAFVSAQPDLPTENRVIYDTICQGDLYVENYFELPPQETVGTFTFYNSFFNPQTCSGDVSATLFLTVQQRYYPVDARICQGEDYMENGFSYRQPVPGVYKDTIYYSSLTGCDSVVTLNLIVNTSFTRLDDIIGNTVACFGSVEIYSVPGTDGLGYYDWEFPAGFRVLAGQKTGKASVQITDRAVGGPVIFRGKNGCGEGEVSLEVTVNPSYWSMVVDSICEGSEYHGNGFHLPALNKVGYETFYQYNKTTMGCDSNMTLGLYVLEKPSVRIAFSDSVICQGQPVRLDALGKDAGPVPAAEVSVGDIYCNDGSIVKPDQIGSSGRIAQGVVFWVDQSGKHGWVVEKDMDVMKLAWGTGKLEGIDGLKIYPSLYLAIEDLSGYDRTRAIRNAGNALEYSAAYAVDFLRGWYLPTVGQMAQLNVAMPEVNASLSAIGGVLLNANYYWTSSLGSIYNIWCLAGWGYFESAPKDFKACVIAIRDF